MVGPFCAQVIPPQRGRKQGLTPGQADFLILTMCLLCEAPTKHWPAGPNCWVPALRARWRVVGRTISNCLFRLRRGRGAILDLWQQGHGVHVTPIPANVLTAANVFDPTAPPVRVLFFNYNQPGSWINQTYTCSGAVPCVDQNGGVFSQFSHWFQAPQDGVHVNGHHVRPMKDRSSARRDSRLVERLRVG
jgi:hypothetical protein